MDMLDVLSVVAELGLFVAVVVFTAAAILLVVDNFAIRRAMAARYQTRAARSDALTVMTRGAPWIDRPYPMAPENVIHD